MSVLFFLLSYIDFGIRPAKDIHRGMKTYFSLVSIMLIGFALFMTYWDWMGGFEYY